MKSTGFRLPEKTTEQLAALAKKLGMTLTQVVVVAIDRMAQKENLK
jgi:predicted DNA-binding protein